MEDSETIKSKVRDWFSQEGTKIESISDPRAEFLYKVKFQRFFFTVVRPNDRNYTQVESQIMISPQHQKLLTAEKLRSFQMETMKFAFEQGIGLGFVQPRPGQPGPQPKGPGFVVSDRIYDDSFNDQVLWEKMRRLHSAIELVIAILNETTGQIGAPKVDDKTDSSPSYYT